MTAPFDLEKFLVDVFDPQPGERAVVMTDLPTAASPDGPAWKDRRVMAAEWRDGLARLGGRVGFEVLPLATYPAAGRSGADFPESCDVGGVPERTANLFDRVSLALVLSEYSPTAALVDVCKRRPGAEVFRAASMPGIEKRMERTSLAADYAAIAQRCRLLKEVFLEADRAEVSFSTGHRCRFDLRHRVCETDDGYLHRDKADDIPVINLPSGETFQVPYEGEHAQDPSRTEGELPVREDGETVVFRVTANRIVEVAGSGPVAGRYRAYFEEDPVRGNIAELAFGCNERAVVTGNVLEDEKAGFHWAYGRSDHLGGRIGLESFRSPAHVVHQDIVYAAGSPIQVSSAVLFAPDGRRMPVIENGEYVLWR